VRSRRRAAPVEWPADLLAEATFAPLETWAVLNGFDPGPAFELWLSTPRWTA
jgi:hypothetical protein